MFIREKDDLIFVYSDLELMLDSDGKNTLNADYVIRMHNNGYGTLIKDRSGLFSETHVPVKKVLKIINFLYEIEEKLV
jgi:hypothetical protein